jgi:hypothetical protein
LKISFIWLLDDVKKGLLLDINKMCYETQMPPYEAKSRDGHHLLNPMSRCQNLWFQYRVLVTRNMYMKYKSSLSYHSKDMVNVEVFGKWVKPQGQGHKVKNHGTNRKVLS